jgi:hypothetical protein
MPGTMHLRGCCTGNQVVGGWWHRLAVWASPRCRLRVRASAGVNGRNANGAAPRAFLCAVRRRRCIRRACARQMATAVARSTLAAGPAPCSLSAARPASRRQAGRASLLTRSVVQPTSVVAGARSPTRGVVRRRRSTRRGCVSQWVSNAVAPRPAAGRVWRPILAVHPSRDFRPGPARLRGRHARGRGRSAPCMLPITLANAVCPAHPPRAWQRRTRADPERVPRSTSAGKRSSARVRVHGHESRARQRSCQSRLSRRMW